MGSNRLLPVLLLALLATCGYCSSGQCPPPEEMPQDCLCSFDEGLEVKCVGNKMNVSNYQWISATIQEIAAALREKFPANTTTLKYLELKYFLRPSKLTSRTFEGLRIKELHIDGGNITSWADKFGGPAFVELEDCLEELHIVGAVELADEYFYRGETEIPAPFSLGHLPKLRRVRFYQNKLFVFGNDWFGKGGGSVEEVDVENNHIHFVGEEALVGLTKLRRLEMGVNKIKELKRSMFPQVPKAEDLDLSFNKMEGLPEDFFTNFTSLESLILNFNPIKYLPQNVFGEIWSQLKKFELWASSLQCDDHINWMLNVTQPEELDVLCDTPFLHHLDDLPDVLYERKKNE